MKSKLIQCLAVVIGIALLGGCATTSRVTSAESELIEKNVKLTDVHVAVLPVRLNADAQPLLVDPSSAWISGEVSRAAAEMVDLLKLRGVRASAVTATGSGDLGKREPPHHVLVFSVPRARKQTSTNFSRKTRTETLVGYEVVLQVFDPVQKKTIWKGQASMSVGAEDTANPLAREFLELLQRDHLI
ncbi:hypothetical protein [Thiobacillus denitrificans]|nr:hypothetical protein [Thiobacillus denitrificans]